MSEELSEFYRDWKEHKKEQRDKRVAQRRVEFDKLRKEGFDVIEYPNYHFKVNGRLNIWPSRNRFYDEISGQKGVIRRVGIRTFVKERLS